VVDKSPIKCELSSGENARPVVLESAWGIGGLPTRPEQVLRTDAIRASSLQSLTSGISVAPGHTQGFKTLTDLSLPPLSLLTRYFLHYMSLTLPGLIHGQSNSTSSL